MVVVQAWETRVAVLFAFPTKVLCTVFATRYHILLACLDVMERPTLNESNPETMC